MSNANKQNRQTGGSRRGRRPAPEAERKDRVIQTRVPRDLESTLRDAADRQRVTVSHLIRNVLEDSVNLVDNIVADSTSLVANVSRDARRIAAAAAGRGTDGTAETGEADEEFIPVARGGEQASALMDSVDAWQDVLINRPGRCVQCGVYISRGERAFRGLTTEPAAPVVWLCPDCSQSL